MLFQSKSTHWLVDSKSHMPPSSPANDNVKHIKTNQYWNRAKKVVYQKGRKTMKHALS